MKPDTLPPVTIPGTEMIDFRSDINGRDYRIMITKPLGEAPAAGYPTLVALDGNAYFGTLTDVSRTRGYFAQDIAEPLVVAVGYPSEHPLQWVSLRNTDLTPTERTMPRWPPDSIESRDSARCGGAADFIEVIEREIKSRVAARHPVDRDDMALLGHSLGGMFVLYTLFTRPELFRTWLAISPSIWWEYKHLLGIEPRLADWRRNSGAPLRLYLSAGGLEESPPTVIPPWAAHLTAADFEGRIRTSQMTTNAREMAARLRRLFDRPEDRVEFDGARQ